MGICILIFRQKLTEALLKEDEALNSLVAQLNAIKDNELVSSRPAIARKIEDILRELGGITPGVAE